MARKRNRRLGITTDEKRAIGHSILAAARGCRKYRGTDKHDACLSGVKMVSHMLIRYGLSK